MIYDGASYRINIEGADSTIILDSWTNTLKANIASSTGEVLLDENSSTFMGKFKGNVVNKQNEIIVDIETKNIHANNVHANLIDHFGNHVFDFETGRFMGNFVGDLYNSSGEVVGHADDATWHGNVKGNVISPDGVPLFDNGMYTGDLSANIFDSEGGIAYDKEQKLFYGNLVGKLVNENGEFMLDTETTTFSGTFDGDVVGNIMDNNGIIVFNPNAGEFSKQVSGEFSGTFVGDIYNEIGEVIYNHSSETLAVKALDVESADGNFSGIFMGDIVNPYTGDTKYDATSMHWTGVSLTGTLYNNNGAEVFNPEASTISVNNVYTRNIIASSLDVDSTVISNEGIFLNVESAWSEPAIEAKFYRDQMPEVEHWFQQGFELCGVGGTWMAPAPSKPGDKLPALTWNATIQTGMPGEDSSFYDSTVQATGTTQKAVVAYVCGKIPDDDKFTYHDDDGMGCSGELHFVVNNVDDGPKYSKIDKYGKLHTTLAEFKVDGETGVIPSEPNTPDSWLQITVNGETKFLPLHS